MGYPMRNGIHHGVDKLTDSIRVYCDPRLKDFAGKAADVLGIPLSEYVTRLIAEHLGRPELGIVPRKQQGRPRNKPGRQPKEKQTA